MRRGAAFTALAALLVGGIAWLVTRRVTDPRAVEAIWTSAGIAVVVQALTFAVARPFVTSNPIAGWGLGSLIRFAVVVGHALLGIPALGHPSGTALVSLVGFFFVTMLFEPLFLRS
jgi:hypothetical protein